LLAVVKILPSLLFIMLLSGIVDGSITTNKMADNAVTAAGPSQDAVHVIWTDVTGINPEILYRTNAGDVFAGFPIDDLSNNAGISRYPAIAVSGNNVYVVWDDSLPRNGDTI
jgi:hypothetical protein